MSCPSSGCSGKALGQERGAPKGFAESADSGDDPPEGRTAARTSVRQVTELSFTCLDLPTDMPDMARVELDRPEPRGLA